MVASASALVGPSELTMVYFVRLVSSRITAWVKASSVWYDWVAFSKTGTATVWVVSGKCAAELAVW